MSISFDYRRAMRIQRILAGKVFESLRNPPRIRDIRFVAGVDASFYNGYIIGVAVLVDYPTRRLIEYSVVEKKPPIPYVPGLLAFREAPAYISAILRLGREPDILMVDGHGVSHPRGLGIASHLGLVLDKPSIGIAKKKLYGEEIKVNGEEYLKAHGLLAARIIRHRGKKLYVSIGYRISLEQAVEITMNLLDPRYNLPLPTHIADRISRKIRNERRRKIK